MAHNNPLLTSTHLVNAVAYKPVVLGLLGIVELVSNIGRPHIGVIPKLWLSKLTKLAKILTTDQILVGVEPRS